MDLVFAVRSGAVKKNNLITLLVRRTLKLLVTKKAWKLNNLETNVKSSQSFCHNQSDLLLSCKLFLRSCKPPLFSVITIGDIGNN